MRYLPCLAIVGLLLSGCATSPDNPSFPVSTSEAHDDIARMQKDPIPFQRPLVVIGGFLDPDVSPPIFADYFQSISCGAKIIPVSLLLCGNMEDCRQTVIEAVDKACPDSDPIWTTEVDVVGASLGGLAGRYAAAPSQDSNHLRRLKIAHLFTISSPHSGAKIAGVIPLTGFGPELSPGSDFLKYVAQFDGTASYEIYPYVHLDDEIVGDRNAAPPGQNPYWLPSNAPLPPHMGAVLDERILADISRRLRGETPYTIPPPEPLPEYEGFQ